MDYLSRVGYGIFELQKWFLSLSRGEGQWSADAFYHFFFLRLEMIFKQFLTIKFFYVLYPQAFEYKMFQKAHVQSMVQFFFIFLFNKIICKPCVTVYQQMCWKCRASFKTLSTFFTLKQFFCAMNRSKTF